MAQVPEFKFDYDKVSGMDMTEAMKALMDQMAAHYNEHIKPAPILFGGVDVARPGADRSVSATHDDPPAPTMKPVISGELVRVKDDYEIKNGADLGLKDGFVLTGVTMEDIEIFDFLKNYTAGDTVVEGESAKYDLGKAK